MIRRLIQTVGGAPLLGETRIPMTTTAWAAATVSTTGAPAVANTIDWAWSQVIVSNATQAALIRQYAGLSGGTNWLPGLINQIDWDKPWRLKLSLRCDIGGTGSGFKWTLFIGGLNAAPTVHTMSAKGMNLCILGTAGDAGTIQIGAHNGSAQVDSTPVARVCDGSLMLIEVQYLPGIGAVLMHNGAAIGTIASASLPTGLGIGSRNGWAFLMEHTIATNGTSNVSVTNMTVEH